MSILLAVSIKWSTTVGEPTKQKAIFRSEITVNTFPKWLHTTTLFVCNV